jgi:CheY-like chemotaxis protein/transcriptional regulator with XRE-family HTH domain
MVVDDEPLICQLLSYQLGGAGYDVTTFHNGFEALGKMANIRPDLIILDVMMPEISGWDLCQQIRSASTIPIIMLTAKQSDHDVVTGLTSGADDYIGKPFSLPQLLARVEAVLRRAGKPVDIKKEKVQPIIEERVGATPMAHAHPVTEASIAHSPRPATIPQVPPRPRLGAAFLAARQARGLSLHDAERGCGVRWEYLQAIEREHFEFIPRPELRQTLHSYSSYVGVDLRLFTNNARRPTARTIWSQSVAVSATLVLLVIMFFVLGLYAF